MNPRLNVEHQAMLTAWQEHLHSEFALKNPDAALANMSENPYVICVPSGAGGEGRSGVRDFYATRFLPHIPPDIEMTPVSQVFGHERFVEEMVMRFTHSLTMDWMTPGLPPTGFKVECLLVVIVGFRDGKLESEHIYWDQASVLSQLGMLDGPLAATGVSSVRRVPRLFAQRQPG
jgi:carboxymethylenebutenolidase